MDHLIIFYIAGIIAMIFFGVYLFFHDKKEKQ